MGESEPVAEAKVVAASVAGLSKPSILILAYTDDPRKVTDTSDGDDFGISRLKRHIAKHAPAFADIKVQLVSRNSEAMPANNLLDSVLKPPKFDEIWFFGIHQKKLKHYTLTFPKGGGPESELNQSEVDLLTAQMRSDGGNPGIGVLMAGDHANPPPDIVLEPSDDLFCPPLDHKLFLSLGRAIGYKVPRAGLMRNWEGPPTHCCEDSFNTQVIPRGGDPYGTFLQADAQPQHLDLKKFDPDGTPNPNGQPHQLFIDTSGQPIDVFPDHMHEGELLMPEPDPAIWPIASGLQPIPRLLAEGTDKRNGRKLKIVAAYDGDAVNLGRIVADSSWHHYFNVNLNLLRADSPKGSDADRIGQYYANLAVWLAPLSVRRQMAKFMLAWLGQHPLIMEEAGGGPLNLGRAAFRILVRVSSPCEINELLAAICPTQIRNRVESLNWPDLTTPLEIPSKEILLGAILEAHYHSVTAPFDPDRHDEFVSSNSIEVGFNRAFTLVANMDRLKLDDPRCPRSKDLPSSLEYITSKRSTIMATEQYSYTATLDRDGSTESFGLELTPHNCISAGRITHCDLSGWLTDPRDGSVFPVTGRRLLFNDGTGLISMDLDYRDLRFKFFGRQIGPLEFRGDFIMVRRGRLKMADDNFNPEEGDTGTAVGTQTLLTTNRSR